MCQLSTYMKKYIQYSWGMSNVALYRLRVLQNYGRYIYLNFSHRFCNLVENVKCVCKLVSRQPQKGNRTIYIDTWYLHNYHYLTELVWNLRFEQILKNLKIPQVCIRYNLIIPFKLNCPYYCVR